MLKRNLQTLTTLATQGPFSEGQLRWWIFMAASTARQHEDETKVSRSAAKIAVKSTANGIPASARATFERIRGRPILARNDAPGEARVEKVVGSQEDAD